MNREEKVKRFNVDKRDLDLPQHSLSDQIGQIGEDYVKEILSEMAIVNSLARDKGLDLHCLLLQDKKVTPYSFFVQVKTRMHFRSLKRPIYIRRSTINLWCLIRTPVYLVLTVLRPQKKAFWANVIEDLSSNLDFLDKTRSHVKLKPPLDNLLTPNSFSYFRDDIIRTSELFERIMQSIAVLERSKDNEILDKAEIQKEFYDLHDSLTRYHLGMSTKSRSQALRTYFSLWEILGESGNIRHPLKLMRVALSTADNVSVTDAIRCLFYMESPTVYQFPNELSALKQKLSYERRLQCLKDALFSIYHEPHVPDPPSWSRIIGDLHLPAIALLLFEPDEVIPLLESLRNAAIVESKDAVLSPRYFDLPSALYNSIRYLANHDAVTLVIQRAARRSMERSFINGYQRNPDFAAHLISWYALFWKESIDDLSENGRKLVLKALTHHSDPRVRLDCAVLVGKKRPDEAIPVLEELCQVTNVARDARKALDDIRIGHNAEG